MLACLRATPHHVDGAVERDCCAHLSTFRGFVAVTYEIMFAQLAWKSFAFLYAAGNLLAILLVAGLRDGAFFKRPSKEAVKELQIGMFAA